jgi:hypothetical protein
MRSAVSDLTARCCMLHSTCRNCLLKLVLALTSDHTPLVAQVADADQNGGLTTFHDDKSDKQSAASMLVKVLSHYEHLCLCLCIDSMSTRKKPTHCCTVMCYYTAQCAHASSSSYHCKSQLILRCQTLQEYAAKQLYPLYRLVSSCYTSAYPCLVAQPSDRVT